VEPPIQESNNGREMGGTGPEPAAAGTMAL